MKGFDGPDAVTVAIEKVILNKFEGPGRVPNDEDKFLYENGVLNQGLVAEIIKRLKDIVDLLNHGHSVGLLPSNAKLKPQHATHLGKIIDALVQMVAGAAVGSCWSRRGGDGG